MKLFALFALLLLSGKLFSQDLIPYRNLKLWGYANKDGKIIIEPQYEKAFPFQKNGLAEVMKGGWYFLINASNEVKSETRLISLAPVVNVSQDQIMLTESLKKAELKKETELIKLNYILKTNSRDYLSSGDLTAIAPGIYIADVIDSTKQNKFGLIDEKNQILIPFEYSTISSNIKEGLVAVSKDGKHGFCDLKGNEVIMCKYAMVDAFEGGIARVYLSRNDYSTNSTGYINKLGIEFFKSEPVYQITRIGGKERITDQYNNPLSTNEEYDFAGMAGNRHFLLYSKNNPNFVKLINTEGKILASGTKIERIDDFMLITRPKNKQVFDLVTEKITVDSLDHIASKISHPVSLELFGYSFKTNEGRYGVISKKGRLAVPPKYAMEQFTGKWFILRTDKFQYAISDTNHIFLKNFSAEEISYLSENLFAVKRKNQFEVYDARTKTLSNYHILPNTSSLNLIPWIFKSVEKKYGFINKATEEILAPAYMAATVMKMFDANFNPVEAVLFKRAEKKLDIYNIQTGKLIIRDIEEVGEIQGRWLPVKIDGNFYFIDVTGKIVFESSYEKVRSVISNGYTAVRKNSKWGIIDRENNLVTSFKYEDISGMVDDIVIVGNGGLYGLRSIKDSILVKEQYNNLSFISSVSNDSLPDRWHFLAEKNGKKGIIDQHNNIIAPFELEGETDFPFSEKVFVVYKKGKPALFNQEGKCVIDAVFDNIEVFDVNDYMGNELALVSKGSKQGLYRLTGETLLPCEYDKIYFDVELYDRKDRIYFTIEKNGKKGLACNTGEIVIPPIYQDIESHYSDDRIIQVVKTGGRYGLYVNCRKKITECVYKKIFVDEESQYYPFYIAETDEGEVLIDTSGKQISTGAFDKITIIDYSDIQILQTSKKGKKGLINFSGKTIFNPEYTRYEPGVDYGYENAFLVYKGKYFGMYSMDGKEILPCNFVEIRETGHDDPSQVFVDKTGKKMAVSTTFEVTEWNEK